MATHEQMSNLYAAPIVCSTEGCERRGKLVNVVSGLSEDILNAFYESYDESSTEDHCPLCGELGITEDPVPEDLMDRIHRGIDWRHTI